MGAAIGRERSRSGPVSVSTSTASNSSACARTARRPNPRPLRHSASEQGERRENTTPSVETGYHSFGLSCPVRRDRCGGLLSARTALRPAPRATPVPDAIDVVATTTVLADLVDHVGGTQVVATSLVPTGGEVHTFDPTPADIAGVADADLIVMNGLGLDDWLADLDRTAAAGATRGARREPRRRRVHRQRRPRRAVNPHLWMDVDYASRVRGADRRAARRGRPRARARLCGQARPTARACPPWMPRSATDRGDPGGPPEVVSFHDAFPYFAAAYGLPIVGRGARRPGPGPERRRHRRSHRRDPGLGCEGRSSPKRSSARQLVDAFADETGVTVVRDLYNDSLGDPPIDTYEGMMRWN